MQKFGLIACILLMLTACSRISAPNQMKGNLYPAEYEKVDNLPFNVELNKRILYQLTDSQPEYMAIKIAYPDYEAEGVLNIVTIDSIRLVQTMERYLRLMQSRADSICEILDSRTPAGFRRWIFVHPHGKEQIQWMATDSTSMYVAGYLHFKAANDSTINITPALENVCTDILHLVDNLEKP